MEAEAFWREQGAKFRRRAETASDPALKQELQELADICEEVAAEMEDRAAAG